MNSHPIVFFRQTTLKPNALFDDFSAIFSAIPVVHYRRMTYSAKQLCPSDLRPNGFQPNDIVPSKHVAFMYFDNLILADSFPTKISNSSESSLRKSTVELVRDLYDAIATSLKHRLPSSYQDFLFVGNQLLFDAFSRFFRVS